MMGITYLPYHACQAVTWSKRIVLGDMKNKYFGVTSKVVKSLLVV